MLLTCVLCSVIHPLIGDISGWNVSSVEYMGCMFSNTPFDGDISLDGMSVELVVQRFFTCFILVLFLKIISQHFREKEERTVS